MRKTTYIYFLLLFTTIAYSQTDKGFTANFDFGSNSVRLNNEKGFKTIDFVAELGYQFNSKFSWDILKIGLASSLFKDEKERKTYEVNTTMGSQIRYKFAKIYEDDLEVVTGLGSTLGETEWHYMYYDAGLRLTETSLCHNIKPYIGLGVRYFNSYHKEFPDRCMLMITIGVKFIKRKE